MQFKSDVANTISEMGVPYGIAAVACDVGEQAALVAVQALNKHCSMLSDQSERVLAIAVGMKLCSLLMENKSEMLPAVIALIAAEKQA